MKSDMFVRDALSARGKMFRRIRIEGAITGARARVCDASHSHRSSGADWLGSLNRQLCVNLIKFTVADAEGRNTVADEKLRVEEESKKERSNPKRIERYRSGRD